MLTGFCGFELARLYCRSVGTVWDRKTSHVPCRPTQCTRAIRLRNRTMRSLAQATAAAALLWSDSTCATVQRDSSPPPPTMRAVKKAGAAACGPPDFSCLDVVDGLPTPVPLSGEVLVRITSSSFNPDDVSNLLVGFHEFTTLLLPCLLP